MARNLIFVFVGIISVSLSEAILPSLRCPKVQVQETFTVPEYVGKWYEYAKYPFIFTAGGKCITATYTENPDGSVGVVNSMVSQSSGSVSSINGTAIVVAPGKLAVSFPSTGNDAGPYWILGTDYTNYAVVWSCTNIGLIHLPENLWILTRERFPDETVINQAHGIMEKNSLSRIPLIRTDQINCN